MGSKRLSNEQELQLVEEYRNGATVISLMEKYNFATKKSITDKVKKHYPNNYQEIIEQARENRKDYNFSLTKIKSYFDAYYIGLMMTDGYITDETRVGIDLTDEDCISFLSKTIGHNYKTYEPSSGDLNIQGKKQRHRLILSDRGLVQDLARFGIVPNKSLTLQPPKLLPEEEKYIPYIIRGIIDGDGCIYKTTYDAPAFYITSKSKDFIDWVYDVLTNKMFMIDLRLYQDDRGMYRLDTALQENIFKLISMSYNQPFGMERKYKLLRKMFRDYNSDFLKD